MRRFIHRLTHPGTYRRLRQLDGAHRDEDGQRVPLAGPPASGWWS